MEEGTMHFLVSFGLLGKNNVQRVPILYTLIYSTIIAKLACFTGCFFQL